MKVLVADDSPMVRKLLGRHLTAWGYEPVFASDGNEAWEVVRGEDPPRLAVIDWSMPGVEGVDLCRRIKEDPKLPFIYTIMLTARDLRKDALEALESGADEYLAKPTDVEMLRRYLGVGQRILAKLA